MNDFTKGLGSKLMLLLWHTTTDCGKRVGGARRDLVARVVDGLRGDSFEHEAELAQIAQEFASSLRGTRDQDLASQFASDLLTIVTGEGDAGDLLDRVDTAMKSVPKLRSSRAAMRRKQEEVRRKKRRALSLLRRIREQTNRELERLEVEPGAPPNRRPSRSRPNRSRKKGGGR